MSIKFTNDVKISSQSLEMFIDTNNLIYSSSFNTSSSGEIYTATQDCFAILIGNASSMSMDITLDSNTKIMQLISVSNASQSLIIPMRKGQVLNSLNYRYCGIKVYGTK